MWRRPCSAWRAAQFAEDWNCHFHLLQGAGHINADSGLGEWEAGQSLFTGWLSHALPVSRQEPVRVLRWVA